MHLKMLIAIAVFIFCAKCPSEVLPAAQKNHISLSVGGGVDYWRGDWGTIARIGPSSWASADLAHGLGINAEGHSMVVGGNTSASACKYFVGEGGLMYSYHPWHRFRPYAKAELGFASLSFPHSIGGTYAHDTHNSWALGFVWETPFVKRLWARVDYTYDGVTSFRYTNLGTPHGLNPAGLSIGARYHF